MGNAGSRGTRESSPPPPAVSVALPSLARSPSYQQYNSNEKLVVEESEDDLYVGGIVKKQSFEEYGSSGDIKSERHGSGKNKKDLRVETRVSSPRGNTTSFGHETTSVAQKRVSSPPLSSRRDKVILV